MIFASALFGNAAETAASNPGLRVLFANTLDPASGSNRYAALVTMGTARTLCGPDTTIVSNTPPIVPTGGLGKSPWNSISCASLTSSTSHPWSHSVLACSASATHSRPESNASRTAASNVGSPYSGTTPTRSVSGRACAGARRRRGATRKRRAETREQGDARRARIAESRAAPTNYDTRRRDDTSDNALTRIVTIFYAMTSLRRDLKILSKERT